MKEKKFKKGNIKKLFSVVLAFAMVFSLLPINTLTAFAAEPAQIGSSSTYWKFEDGVLTISGTGDMPDWKTVGWVNTPWFGFLNDITSIVIQPGVESIGSYSFELVQNATVSLPEGLRDIKEGAFHNSRIREIYIPASVVRIDNKAFGHCIALESVRFAEYAKVYVIGDDAFEDVGVSGIDKTTLDLPSSAYSTTPPANNSTSWYGGYFKVLEQHVHDFSYSVTTTNTTGDTLVATCSNSDNRCNLTTADKSVSLVLNATPSMAYTGYSYNGASHGSTSAWKAAGLTVPLFKYVGRNSTEYPERTISPSEPGTYTVKLSAGTPEVSAMVDFVIEEPHEHVFSLALTDTDTFTARCTAEECPTPDSNYSIRLTTNENGYSGIEGLIAFNDATKLGVDAGEVKFYKVETEGVTTGGVEKEPLKQGYYYAALTLGGQTAVKAFTLTKDAEKPLTFTALEDNSSIRFKLFQFTSVKYSINGSGWSDYTSETEIKLNKGEYVQFIANFDTNVTIDSSNYSYFSVTGKIEASGDVTSLCVPTGGDVKLENPSSGVRGVFYRLFKSCANLTKAPNLPSTMLGTGCYNYMFDSCTGLSEAPELPATTLTNNCYQNMFSGCTGLKEAPELPATTLTDNCYYGMFQNCTGLTKIPNLPATALATSCYMNMFFGCSSLGLRSELEEGYEIKWTFPVTDDNDSRNMSNMFKNCPDVQLGSWAMPAFEKDYYQKGVLHEHSFDYSLSGDGESIVAECSNADGKCKLDDDTEAHAKKVTLTLSATDTAYSASGYSGASLDGLTAWENAKLTAPTIKYVGRGSTSYIERATAPTNAGTYTAKITVGSVTLSKDFTISKLSVSDPASGEGYTINYSEETISSDADYEVKTADEIFVSPAGEDVAPGNVYYVRKKGDKNHAPSSWTSFTIASRPAKPSGYTAVSPTAVGGTDGKITGVNSTMEYSVDGGGTWTSVTGTEITGLPARRVLLRMKATSSAFASESAEVRIHGHIKKTKHDAVPGTCKTKGTLEYYECSGCDVKLSEEGSVLASVEGAIDASNHEGTTTWTKTATTHKEEYSCCGAVKTAEEAHNFGYSATNNVITATCQTSDCAKSVSLTITATSSSYSGIAYTGASLGDTSAWTGAGLTEPTINYAGRGNTTYTESETAPTAVGTYTASITAGDKNASVDFEITKADRAGLTVLMSDYAYNSTPSTPSISPALSEGEATYYYNATNSNAGGTVWAGVTATTLDTGTYYMYAVVGESANYNAFTTPAISFTITGDTLGDVNDTAPTAVDYDGKQHGITTDVTCTTDGTTIKYGTVEGTYGLSTAPTFIDAGTHTIYYQITKRGYTPKTGSVDVVINPKEVTVSGITAVNKNYDGNTTVTLNYSNVTIAGKVTGDDLSVTATGTLDSANAGTGKTVTISGITLTGAKADNYTLAASGNQTSTTATVNKVALTLSEPTSYAPTNVTGKPVIKENTSNPLVTASTNTLPDGIHTEYKLDVAGGDWSPSIPTATGVSAGTYKVYYRFAGDTNHNPLENPSWYVTVEVAVGSVTVTATGATSENLDVVGVANKVAGKDVTITLNVASKADTAVTNKDVMESKVDDVFNGASATKAYLDIHIEKAVDGEGTTQITNTTTPIEIAYAYTLDSATAYVIIRDHNGAVTAFKQLATRPTGSYVDGTYYLDDANDIVYIYSKYFSDYMIASVTGHTVIFNSNGGSAVDQIIVSDGATIASLPTPTKSGYTFNGWYSDAGLSTAFTTATTISGDIAVYAKWTQNSSGGSSSGSNGGSSSSDSSSSAEASKTITVTVNVTHTVVKGDTMSRIARKYGLTLAQLAALNPQIKNINRIYPGQIINVGSETKTVTETETKQAEVKAPSRSVTTYIVKKGDTLIKIARNNRMSLAELAALNGQIKNLHWIYPGQVINIHK